MKTTGKVIKDNREINRMTQNDLAEKLGEDRTIISRWENDLIVPSLEQSEKICGLFQISLDELAGGERYNSISGITRKKTELSGRTAGNSRVKDVIYKELAVTVLCLISAVLKPYGLAAAIAGLLIAVKEKLPVYLIIINIIILLFCLNLLLYMCGFSWSVIRVIG